MTINPTPEAVVSASLTPRNSPVQVINICELHEAMYGEGYWTSVRDIEQDDAALKAWCSEHGASYYADPREDFFISKAVGQAEDEGNVFVVVEDLS